MFLGNFVSPQKGETPSQATNGNFTHQDSGTLLEGQGGGPVTSNYQIQPLSNQNNKVNKMVKKLTTVIDSLQD